MECEWEEKVLDLYSEIFTAQHGNEIHRKVFYGIRHWGIFLFLFPFVVDVNCAEHPLMWNIPEILVEELSM